MSAPGDAFFVVFDDAADALRCCAEAQTQLGAHPWPPHGRVAVRMGMHCGPSTPVGHDFAGVHVHRGQRVSAAAYGGQVLVSGAVRDAVAGRDLGGLWFDDVGSYLLKDFDEPERLFRLQGPGLPTEPSVPRAMPAGISGLPATRTAVIGRERDLGACRQLLSAAPVLTLTGPGGMGKTRLAVELAGALPTSGWFVDLAAVRDHGDLHLAIGAALGVASERDPTAALAGHIGAARCLLVLDTCEHVADQAAELLEVLLPRCPGLQVLATSREPLGVTGEQVYRLEPLELPPADDPTSVAGSAAAQLFVAMVRASSPAFVLDEATTALVASTCRRLDGVPLAMEVVAGRVGASSIADVARSLDQVLQIPSRKRVVADRQRTLAATLDWSHELLTATEQVAFRRLAFLRGSFDVELATVASAFDKIDASEVAFLLDALVERSLVAVSSREPLRYRLYETVASYGRRRLDEAGETIRTAAAVADAVTSAAPPDPRGSAAWLDRLASNYGTLSAATDVLAPADPVRAWQLADALTPLWQVRGQWIEGLARLTALLDGEHVAEMARTEPPAIGCRIGAAQLAQLLGRLDEAAALATQTLATIGAAPATAEVPWAEGVQLRAHRVLGTVEQSRGRYAEARREYLAAAELAGRLGDVAATTELQIALGALAAEDDDPGAAVALLEEGLAAARQHRLLALEGRALSNLAAIATMAGGGDSGSLLLESLAIRRQLGDRRGEAMALLNLGDVRRRAGLLDEAEACARSAFELFESLHEGRVTAIAIGNLAQALAAAGRDEDALVLFAAADAAAAHLPRFVRDEFAASRAEVATRLSSEVVAREEALGASRSLADALAAVDRRASVAQSPSTGPTRSARLPS